MKIIMHDSIVLDNNIVISSSQDQSSSNPLLNRCCPSTAVNPSLEGRPGRSNL